MMLKSDKIGVLQHENEEMKEEMCRLKERMEKGEARDRFVDKLMNLLVEKRGASELAKEMAQAGMKEQFEERYS